jgi:hypothetical protein
MSTSVTPVPASPFDLIGSSFRQAWETFKVSLGPIYILIIIFYLIIFVIELPLIFVAGQTEPGQMPGATYWLLSLILALLVIPLGVGLQYGALQIVRGARSFQMDWLLAGYRRWIPVLIATIAAGVLIACGYVLFVIPGIWLGSGLWAAGLLTIDQGYDGIDAVKASWAMLQGYKLAFFVWSIVAFVVVMLGALLCLVGLIVAIPVVLLAEMSFYDQVLALNPPRAAGTAMSAPPAME